MENYLIELFCTLIGATLGSSGIIGLYFYLEKRKANFSEVLFLEYKNISEELAAAMQDLLLLSLSDGSYSQNKCNEIDRELGKIFFKHYLVLPQSVLEEINCLHECLMCAGKKVFMIKVINNEPHVCERETEEEMRQLFEDVAIVTKDKTIFQIYKKYKDCKQSIPMRRSVFLKCQARQVLTVLDREWQLKDIHNWSEKLGKNTIASIRKPKNNEKTINYLDLNLISNCLCSKQSTKSPTGSTNH